MQYGVYVCIHINIYIMKTLACFHNEYYYDKNNIYFPLCVIYANMCVCNINIYIYITYIGMKVQG